MILIVLSLTGRLSKEEIKRMVKDAEDYKAEDDKQQDRIQAKNNLESYAFNMKSTVEEEKLKDKISDENKEKLSQRNNLKSFLGWTAASWPRRKSLSISRRNWRVCPSSRRCTRLAVLLMQVECLEVCRWYARQNARWSRRSQWR